MASTDPTAGTRSPAPDTDDTAKGASIQAAAPDYLPEYLRMPVRQPPHLARPTGALWPSGGGPRGSLLDVAQPEAMHPQPRPHLVALRNYAQLLFMMVLFVVLIVVAWEWVTGGWHF
jgi:hypothetical protein